MTVEEREPGSGFTRLDGAVSAVGLLVGLVVLALVLALRSTARKIMTGAVDAGLRAP